MLRTPVARRRQLPVRRHRARARARASRSSRRRPSSPTSWAWRPSEDVRSRYAIVTDFTQRDAAGRRAFEPAHRRLPGLRLAEPLRRVRRARRRPGQRSRQPRAAREHRERRPRRLADRHLRRPTNRLTASARARSACSGTAAGPRSGATASTPRSKPCGTPTRSSPPGGYVVLMTIPFRTMRFPETLEQRWRIQFERLIPRASEESYWPAYSQTRRRQAESGRGAERRPRRLAGPQHPDHSVRVRAQLRRARPELAGGPGFDDGTEDEIGLDAKVVLRDSFVLDMTLQPRLQPGRVRPAAGHRQRALRGAVPRAAAVLPRERRLLRDRDAAAGDAPHRRSRGRRQVHGHAGQVGHRRDADERRGAGHARRDRSALRRGRRRRRAARVPRLRRPVARGVHAYGARARRQL